MPTCKSCGSTRFVAKIADQYICLDCHSKQAGVKPKRKLSHDEDDIQAEFFRVASLMFPMLDKLLYHACNEGKRNAKRAKRIGIKAGVPDVHLAIANNEHHSLYIEFKSGSNKQTPDQIEFQKQAESAGNKYVVCYSVNEAIEILKEYLR